MDRLRKLDLRVPVAGESQRYARVKMMESVIEHIERGGEQRAFPLPRPL